MAGKSPEEILQSDRKRVAEAVDTLMKADPSDRRAVLMAKLFQHAVSPDPERRQIGADYYTAWVTVKGDGAAATQDTTMRHAIHQEIQFERRQQKEREKLAALDRRVENLEAMLGRIEGKLADE